MELVWKEIGMDRLIARETAQVRVRGSLPTPDGSTPDDVLTCSAKVIIDSAEVLSDAILLKGRIEANVTAADRERKAFSYVSSAAFEHTIHSDSVQKGMNASVECCIQSISAAPNEKSVELSVDVDMKATVVSSIPIKVTGGITGVDDLEIKSQALSLSKKREVGSAVLRMRDELACDDVSDVISSEGIISIREAVIEQGGATISGVITISAITAEKNGHLSQLMRQVPFRERMQIDMLEGDIVCTGSIENIYLRALGEEFSLISMEAEVSLKAYVIDKDEVSLPIDVYSPTISFDCLSERIQAFSCLGIGSEQTVIKELLSLPDNASELNTPLFVNVRPIVTETVTGKNAITVNGVFVTEVNYESTSLKLCSFTEDIPFSFELENRYGAKDVSVRPYCIGFVSGTGERSVQVQYTLILDTEFIGITDTSAVVGLAEKERKELTSGIVICFASNGDGFFDVGKRYSVPTRLVREYNPDLEEPFKEGEKLILMT